MKNYSESDLSYFAGFFDGEGSISIKLTNRTKYDVGYGAEFVIGNNDLEVLKWIEERFGGKIYLARKAGSYGGGGILNNKDFFKWHIDLEIMRRLIPDLIPYLKTKKQKAILLLEFITKSKDFRGRNGGRPEWYRKWQNEIYEKMRILNGKKEYKNFVSTSAEIEEMEPDTNEMTLSDYFEEI